MRRTENAAGRNAAKRQAVKRKASRRGFREAAQIEALITRAEILESLLNEATKEAGILVTAFKRHRQSISGQSIATATQSSAVARQLQAMDA